MIAQPVHTDSLWCTVALHQPSPLKTVHHAVNTFGAACRCLIEDREGSSVDRRRHSHSATFRDAIMVTVQVSRSPTFQALSGASAPGAGPRIVPKYLTRSWEDVSRPWKCRLEVPGKSSVTQG